MNDFDEIIFSPEVTPEAKGNRLDKFLVSCYRQFSRAQVQKLINLGNVLCDDVVISDCAHKIKVGDVYQIYVPAPQEAIPSAEDINLDIVYEDEDLVVVNKPAGMTVHPAPGNYSGTLVNALLFHCQGQLSGIGGVKRPGIVHRIDKETSGLLVVAKNDAAHHGLSEQFAEHSLERSYRAFVYGVPKPLEGRIETNIGRSKYDRKKMAVLPNGGKMAITNYKTLEIFKQAAAFIECRLETGRTHQIRVHMSNQGNALIGDKVYVKSKKESVSLPPEAKTYVNSFPRQALHAKSLGFIHPRTHEKMLFDSEIPADMQELYEILSRI